MSSVRERAVAMLGQGVAQHIVAEAVGVTPGYISQLLGDPTVASDVAAIRAESVQQDLTHDTLVNKLALRALQTLEMKMSTAKVGEVTRMFEVLNKARRLAMTGQNADAGNAVHVTIVLPKAAEGILQINAQNQVIDIDGKTIAPLPSKALPALASRLAQQTPVGQVAPDGTRQVMLGKPEPAHVVEFREAVDEKEKKAAEALLVASKDFVMQLNGVEVVI